MSLEFVHSVFLLSADGGSSANLEPTLPMEVKTGASEISSEVVQVPSFGAPGSLPVLDPALQDQAETSPRQNESSLC